MSNIHEAFLYCVTKKKQTEKKTDPSSATDIDHSHYNRLVVNMHKFPIEFSEFQFHTQSLLLSVYARLSATFSLSLSPSPWQMLFLVLTHSSILPSESAHF